MKMKNIITAIIGIVLLFSVVSATVITIEPETLEPLQIHSGEIIKENITIKTDGDYLVFIDYTIINNTNNMEGFSINLPIWVFVEEEKTFQIEMSTVSLFKPDSFVIHFFISTEGVEAEETSSNEYNETTEIINTGLGIELEIESNGTGNVTVRKFTENPASGFSIPSLNKFFHIEVSEEIEQGMNETIIKVFYTDEEVNTLGIDENELRLYFFDEITGSWQLINSWVDTTNNIVYGRTNHFSLWGVFGSIIPTQPSGSGRRTIYVEKRITKYVNNTIEVPKEIEIIKEIENIDKINELEKKNKSLLIAFTAITLIVVVLLMLLLRLKRNKRNEKVS